MSSDAWRSFSRLAAFLLAGVAPWGCDAPVAPQHPTWADVQPILQGHCTHCHGTTAAATGAGYRFDFYDMSPEVCGEAAEALGAGTLMAHGLAPLIARAITSESPDVRPAMPPLPAQYLAEWEWTTLLRWVADPQRGVKGRGRMVNRPPTITVDGTPDSADTFLDVVVVIADADSDPVVGVLQIGDERLKMDRSGSFSARLDTSGWPVASRPMTAVLCDGWSNVRHELGLIQIAHGP